MQQEQTYYKLEEIQTQDDDTVQPLLDVHGKECKCPFNERGQPITEVNNSIVGIDYDVGTYSTPFPKPSVNA